ncbi:MAG: hypothetical protein AAGI45_17335 [Cyanobacteria bacterium P01_H01_bin.26]
MLSGWLPTLPIRGDQPGSASSFDGTGFEEILAGYQGYCDRKQSHR